MSLNDLRLEYLRTSILTRDVVNPTVQTFVWGLLFGSITSLMMVGFRWWSCGSWVWQFTKTVRKCAIQLSHRLTTEEQAATVHSSLVQGGRSPLQLQTMHHDSASAHYCHSTLSSSVHHPNLYYTPAKLTSHVINWNAYSNTAASIFCVVLKPGWVDRRLPAQDQWNVWSTWNVQTHCGKRRGHESILCLQVLVPWQCIPVTSEGTTSAHVSLVTGVN